MLRSTALVIALAGPVLLPACGRPGTTEVVVVIDTDHAVPAELDAIEVDILGPGGGRRTESAPMASAAELPYTLTLVPDGSVLGPVRLTARGLHAGTVVVTREARFTLTRYASQTVRLDLLRACDASATTCTGADQTCGAGGVCGTIDVTPAPWTGTPARLPDAGADAR